MMSAVPPAPKPVVVDASVGLKWYVVEDLSAEACVLLDGGFELHVPTHFHVEVAATLWKKAVLRGELTADEARQVWADLGAVPVVSYPTAGLLDEALEVALATRRTVYDSLYLALAERLGCVAVTADQKLYNATRGGPYAARVQWVGDPL